MKQSENIASLAKALVIAQSNIQSGVLKNQKNDVFDSGYADLGAVINACKSALNDAGIFVIQSPTATTNNGYVHLTTRLIHESGEWIEDTATAPMVHLDPQGFGSAISYLRRYALASMVGLYQADDDDGASASREGVRVGRKSDNPAPAPGQQPDQPGDTDDVPPAIKKRMDKWLSIIKTATADQLETAKTNAQSSFSGSFLDNILSAVETRERELAGLPV